MSTTMMQKSLISSRNNVSKLERLNIRVSKLLTVAVHEVLEVVRETVSEYQEKTARTQRENERLRLKLQDALEQLEREREVSRLAAACSSVNSLSTQTPLTPCPEACPEDQAVKVEEPPQAAEAESVCDLRVALTLADMCQSEADHGNSTDLKENQDSGSGHLPADCVPVVVDDIKTETDAERSTPQQQMSQANFDDKNLGDPAAFQGFTGTSSYDLLFPQSDLSTPGRPVMTTKSTKSTSQVTRTMRGPWFVESHGCRVCGKTFSRVGNLRIHERCHTGEKPHCCSVCGRCFIQAGDLKKHKRVHTGEKPYYCLQCGKNFSRRENLKRHQKIHLGASLHHKPLWMDSQ